MASTPAKRKKVVFVTSHFQNQVCAPPSEKSWIRHCRRSLKLNDMDSGLCLEGLIDSGGIISHCSRMSSHVCLQTGGQRVCRNHTLHFPKITLSFLNSLPMQLRHDLPFLTLRSWMGLKNSHRNFKVRQTRIYNSQVEREQCLLS